MGQQADELRAQARRLEERAQKIADDFVRSALLSVVHSRRELADKVERLEMEPSVPRSKFERLHRKTIMAGVDQAIRRYWEHTRSLPIPDRLINFAEPAEGNRSWTED